MKATVKSIVQPSRAGVLATLNELVTGKISREEAAAWAGRWLTDDVAPGTEVQVMDRPAWEALTSIASADLYGGDRPYLYSEEDFAAWAAELMAAPNVAR